VIATNQELIGIDLADGTTKWMHSFDRPMSDFALDQSGDILYLVDRKGLLEACQPTNSDVSVDYPYQLESLWSIELERSTSNSLIPLPNGGVAISSGGKLVAFSDMGELTWYEGTFPPIQSWDLMDEILYLTTTGDNPGLWVVRPLTRPELLAQTGGLIAPSDDLIWIYNDLGISIFDINSRQLNPIHTLPTAFPALGAMEVLPSGELLLLHTDIYDRRLMVFNTSGSLEWERSFSSFLTGQPILLEVGGQPLLIAQDTSSQTSEVVVFSLDSAEQSLLRILEAGTRNLYSRATWGVSIDGGKLLLNIGGSHLLLLDPSIAVDEVSNSPTSP
jgi:hypothetical protein